MVVKSAIEIGCAVTSRGFQPIVKNVTPFENNDVWLCSMGDMMNGDGTVLDSEEKWNYYLHYGKNLCNYISGTYILVLYVKKTSELFVFSDSLGSSVHLFYVKNENDFFVSSSLRTLLEVSNIDRHLNDDVVPSFLMNGYVVGHQTLLKRVNKLVPGYCLQYSDGTSSLYPHYYVGKRFEVNEALLRWNDTLSASVNRFRKMTSHTAIALSSGYDSNYILHALSSVSSGPINGYSIGGDFVGNELPVVESIAAFYPNLQLMKAVTDSSTFLSFPEIVRRMEGQVYERGIFLQYELAKAMAENGEKDVICGECANEIMHVLYNDNDKTDLTPVNSLIYGHDPYISASYLILKKSGILMNSFGIQSHYPFTDALFKSLCITLRYQNGYDKGYHIANCRQQMSPDVFQLLANKGGATKLESMLTEQNRFMLQSLMKENNYYQQYGQWLMEHRMSSKDFVMRSANYNLHIRNPFRLIKSELRTRKGEWEAKITENENIQDDTMMSCLYMDIFEKMFIQNKICHFAEKVSIQDVYSNVCCNQE